MSNLSDNLICHKTIGDNNTTNLVSIDNQKQTVPTHDTSPKQDSQVAGHNSFQKFEPNSFELRQVHDIEQNDIQTVSMNKSLLKSTDSKMPSHIDKCVTILPRSSQHIVQPVSLIAIVDVRASAIPYSNLRKTSLILDGAMMSVTQKCKFVM